MDLQRGRDGLYRIDAFLYGSPAHKSGLRVGDVVASISGKQLSTMKPSAVAKLLTAPAGTKVNLVYLDGGKSTPLQLVVEETPDAEVKGRLLPDNIIYVRLPNFENEAVLGTLTETIKKLQKQAKGEVPGLILDLRANPGGDYKVGVHSASLFLESGTLVSARMRNGALVKDETWRVIPVPPFMMQDLDASFSNLKALLEKKPMVVLVDGSTASCAEILTGALKDNRRALVVGMPTFGKSVAWSKLELPNDAVLTVTTMKYLTPNGYDVSLGGIKPDVLMAQPRDGSDKQLATAVAELEKMIQSSTP
jgi:carboxyl-terminal processing protease